MTKNELIAALQQGAIQKREGQFINKADVEAVLDALADITRQQMSLEEGEVPLPGIGKLKAHTRAGREGRNPATGEAISIAPSHGVKLVLAKTLKDALNP